MPVAPAVLLVLMVAACATGGAKASTQPSPPAPIWQVLAEPPAGLSAMREGLARPFAIVRFDRAAYVRRLADAGIESDPKAPGAVIELPFPDGTFERFRVKESPMLAPELAKAFPEVRTYSGQGIDDPTSTTRFGWTEAGFHAIVLTGTRGNIYIDTWSPDTRDLYLSYRKSPFI